MNRARLFCFLAWGALLLSGCGAQQRKPAAQTAPPLPEKAGAAEISPENIKKAEGLYYKAVDAYSKNDMKASLEYLGEILVINPSSRSALELRKKIRIVTGGNTESR